MTTRDDSFRLDKAIRDAVAFGGLPLSGRFEAAFAAVLDLHKPETYGMRQVCEHCIGSDEDPFDYPCATVKAIARELRVSGVDRSEPTTHTPRVWPIGSDEPAEPGLVVHGNGIQFEYDSVWCRWRALSPAGDGDFHTWRRINNYPDGQTLTEVVDTPAGPQ